PRPARRDRRAPQRRLPAHRPRREPRGPRGARRLAHHRPDSAHAALRDLRSMIGVLSAAEAGSLPTATLDWPSLTARLRGRDPQARIDIDPAVADTARVEPAVQAALLRIAAEAVTNAVRHGEAPLSLQVRVGADGVDLSLVNSRARASAPGE